MRKIITIDCEYVYPAFAAAYLVHENGRAYFVETNTKFAVPRMMEALAREGLNPEQVEFVVITHVHLDHAGGAHDLMQLCSRAQLLCHPRAARHIIDPSKLEASARQVYGDAAFESLYGKLLPVPANRVRALEDNAEVPFGTRGALKVLHTRGHANHHLCLFDTELNSVFTGDSFGLYYPAIQAAAAPMRIFPSSSPTDFDAEQAIASVNRILALSPSRVLLTHFGEISDVRTAGRYLLEHLLFSGKVLEQARNSVLAGKALAEFCEKELRDFVAAQWAEGPPLAPEQWELIRMDLELNGAGIAYVAEKQRSRGHASG